MRVAPLPLSWPPQDSGPALIKRKRTPDRHRDSRVCLASEGLRAVSKMEDKIGIYEKRKTNFSFEILGLFIDKYVFSN